MTNFNMKISKTFNRHCEGGPIPIAIGNGTTVAIPKSVHGMGDRHALLSVGLAMTALIEDIITSKN